ncbi:uncharacterized protein LOC131360641 [Hemibagrus wyckioides]|uniref:uncharacterized protein LOC131360641 n=1 Tax=Hemibagrus wyckioides TaxID=337641 RepID=UPI00266D8EFC|nr:uncharacterized protein LOC131360641 [Hemibagrus wyckioides]
MDQQFSRSKAPTSLSGRISATLSHGPVCEQATEPALVQSTKVHQDQMMQEAMKVITQLEKEKFDLIHQVKALQDGDLKSEFHRMMENLTNYEKLLKVSLSETEEKHQKAVETITKLEEEKSDLTDQVKTLRDTVEDMGNQLCETLLQCEKEQEAHRLLKSEHQEMMETLTNSETSPWLKLMKNTRKLWRPSPSSTKRHSGGHGEPAS